MDHVCVAFPISRGRTTDARAFMEELERHRKAEYDVSERRIGITKELWFLAPAADGEQLIGYIESPDFGRAIQAFAASQEPFDLWFKRRMHDVTGVDFSNLPPDLKLPELLSHYETAATV